VPPLAAGAVLLVVVALLSRVEALPDPALPSAPTTLASDRALRRHRGPHGRSQHWASRLSTRLWTDGAVKRRWISLPPGTAIDASDQTHGFSQSAPACGRSSPSMAGGSKPYLRREA
jgi:hypothetical protein